MLVPFAILATPLVLGANQNLTLSAIDGPIGLDGFSFEVVPEPTSAAILIGLGLCGLTRRRR